MTVSSVELNRIAKVGCGLILEIIPYLLRFAVRVVRERTAGSESGNRLRGNKYIHLVNRTMVTRPTQL